MIAAALALSCLWAAAFAPPLTPPHPLQGEIDRLIGHEVAISADSYEVLSAAGEGAPFVGCVRKRGDSLVLASEQALYTLTGPLAIARIAGPNYKVWIIGELDAEQQLFARRIGILASPSAAQCPASQAYTSQTARPPLRPSPRRGEGVLGVRKQLPHLSFEGGGPGVILAAQQPQADTGILDEDNEVPVAQQ